MPPVIFETEILESSTSAHAAKSALHTPLSNQTTGQCHIWMLARFSSLTTLPNWITADYWPTCMFPTFKFHQLPYSVLQIPRQPRPETHIEFLITSPACLWEWFWRSKHLADIWMLARFSCLVTLPNSTSANYRATCEFPTFKLHQLLQIPGQPRPKTHVDPLSSPNPPFCEEHPKRENLRHLTLEFKETC